MTNVRTFRRFSKKSSKIHHHKKHCTKPYFNLSEFKYIITDFFPDVSDQQLNCITEQVARQTEIALFNEIRRTAVDFKKYSVDERN